MFIYGYAEHRYLHSFPTRRSSDLRRTRHQWRHRVPHDDRQFAAGGACGTDRKSTRLNSSHVAISYAVFCLKKKRKHLVDAKDDSAVFYYSYASSSDFFAGTPLFEL